MSAEAQGRILVLDAGGGREASALLALDSGTKAGPAKATFKGQADQMVRSPDGTRLLVHERVGPSYVQRELAGSMRGASGRLSGEHALTVVDAKSLQILSRNPLGPERNLVLRDGLFSPDGRHFTVVVDAFKAPKKIMLVNRAVVSVDLTSGELAGWVALPREVEGDRVRLFGVPAGNHAIALATEERPGPCNCPADMRSTDVNVVFVDLTASSIAGQLAPDGDLVWSDLSPDRKFLVLVQRGARPKKGAAEALSRVRFIDLSTRQVTATVELKGIAALNDHVMLAPDGKHLYLLDTTNNHLEVVSLENQAHAGIFPVGGAAGCSCPKPRLVIDPDRSHVLVLGAGSDPTPGASGEFHLLQGAGIAAAVKVAARPFGASVSESGDRIYVFGEGGLTQLSWPGLEKLAEAPAPLPSNVLDVQVTRDGKRAFALDSEARVSVLDLNTGSPIASVPIASTDSATAKKWALFSLGAAVNAVSLGPAAAANAALSSRGPWEPDRPDRGTLVLRPDGEFAYAFDPRSGVVTVLEAQTARVVDKLVTPGQWLSMLPGGRMLAVEDSKVLRLIDMTTNKKGNELSLAVPSDGFAPLIVSRSLPGSDVFLVARGASAYLLDGATGRIVNEIGGLHRVVDVIIEP